MIACCTHLITNLLDTSRHIEFVNMIRLLKFVTEAFDSNALNEKLTMPIH